MREMELEVLKVIEFDVNCTASQTFLENYSRVIFTRFPDPNVLIYASFLLDLAMIKTEFLQFETSIITLCALSLSLQHEAGTDRNMYGQEF